MSLDNDRTPTPPVEWACTFRRVTAAPTFDFSGAHICVTGGSNGIGLGLAAAFADAGAAVMVTGTRAAASDYDHADLLGRFHYAQMNMDDPAQIDAVVEHLFAMDVLVNNAGATFARGLDESTPDGFDAAVQTNLLGGHRFVRGCEALLKASEHPGGGAVINVASMAATRPSPLVPGYGAAKAAVIQMTRHLGLVWAADGVRVNAIAPGLVESNMTAVMKEVPDLEAAELAKVPLGRWGTPADLVGAVLFLASPAAAFVTGQTLNVDGGYSLT
jgi:NAD(P)-dependent dehydrogenase (short-subunit alcohol dehydrogenase family)